MMSDPPFYKTAAKFLAALATSVVGAGAVILAAVDDDHVTTSEWVAIVLAVLAGVAGSATVYGVRNAMTREQVREAVASVPTTLAKVPRDGSAAAARRYPPPTQRGAAVIPPVDPGIDRRDPWIPPDEY